MGQGGLQLDHMKLLCSGRRAIAVLLHHGNTAAHPGSANPMAWFRCLSTAPRSIDLNSASYILWGAGTDVGKTTVAAGLAYTATMKKVYAHLHIYRHACKLRCIPHDFLVEIEAGAYGLWVGKDSTTNTLSYVMFGMGDPHKNCNNLVH